MHLEKHLGTRLLNRSSRSLSLTESGKLFLERCKGILEDVEEAELVVGSISGVPRGTLRVSAPSWAASRTVVDMVAAYRQRYPEVVVDYSFEDRFVDLVEEGYDLAIRATADPLPAGLIARPSRVVLRFGSSMTVAVAHAVCAGIGLAPLPRMIFEDPMFSEALCPVLTNHPLRQLHWYAIYVSRKHLPLKIRTFIDHLIEVTRIPYPWEDAVTVERKRSIRGTPVVSLVPEE
jgi:DNA-binding transcriptional LysR family regulator